MDVLVEAKQGQLVFVPSSPNVSLDHFNIPTVKLTYGNLKQFVIDNQI